jgi:hypothetical protein
MLARIYLRIADITPDKYAACLVLYCLRLIIFYELYEFWAIVVMMEAVWTSETSVYYNKTKGCYIV